jgi:phage gpG-like protein
VAVQTRGLAEAIAHLEAVQARARDLSPVLSVAAADTVALIDDAFESGVSPNGSPFAALATSTQRQRRKGRGTGANKILVDTSRLRNSVNATGDARALKFGTNVGYGLFHQIGTRRMQRRPYLPIDGSPGGFTLTQTGTAGPHWAAVRANIKHYILTGEVR